MYTWVNLYSKSVFGYKCACKDIYVKYLVTYLEGTQQTTINPYELIVIPDGKSNSDYTRNLSSVF